MTGHPPVSREAFDEMYRLVAASLSGEMSSQQRDRLNQLIHEDAQSRSLYLKLIFESSILLTWAGHAESKTAQERTPSPLPASGVPAAAFHGVTGYFSSGWPIAYLIATFIFALGLTIGAVVHVSRPDQAVDNGISGRSLVAPVPGQNRTSVVGRITGMVDCQWEGSGFRGRGSGDGTKASPLIHLGDRLALESGLLEITYDTGARVILQGPVTYAVESPAGGYLSVGKLTARLEKGSATYANPKRQRGTGSESGRNQHSSDLCPLTSDLFAIRTPTAIVTDLGTEFGVEVDKSGSTRSIVFRGSVQIQRTAHTGRTESPVQVLHQNQSAWVDSRVAGGITLLGPANKPMGFVRRIPTTAARALNLVDVVAGGDGFGSARDRGIDPTTGRTAAEQPSNQDLPGDGRYHRVAELPLVDGVFVPCGGKSPVQLDSAGHVFGGFPTTAKGTWGCIWAGGVLPNPGWPVMSARLQRGLDYSSAWHSVLGMHANKGITFDLDAIRQANTGYRVTRFSAAAGRSVMVETDLGKCDIWVFVDGQPRFRREQITTDDGEQNILVPLDGRNRFLTLVATDGGDGPALDTVVFGDPVLTLERCSDASDRSSATSGESKHGDQ